MSRDLLTLTGVGKDFSKIESSGGRLALVSKFLQNKSSAKVFTAVNDVNLTVKAGQSVGLIGANGAGKSTLLKIIAGVAKPTRGSVVVNGRIGALLELGAGFHPEYTGAQNLELSALLLGITPRELAAKRESIIEFANLGDHLSDPIKHYSSGMVVRLGFAIASALSPDLLITDEVLAVGDESFQKKCMSWITQYLASGGTLLLCSHSMYHIKTLCRDALWLHEGKVRQYGPSADVTSAYLAWHDERAWQRPPEPKASDMWAKDFHRIRKFYIEGESSIEAGGTLAVRGTAYSPDGRPPVILVGIVRADGTPVYGVATEMDGVNPRRQASDLYSFGIDFTDLALLPGSYILRGHALDPEGIYLFDHFEVPFAVHGDAEEIGLARLNHDWADVDPLRTESVSLARGRSRAALERLYPANRDV
jgi:lipopolysaccharide transport system ATP-binding protein